MSEEEERHREANRNAYRAVQDFREAAQLFISDPTDENMYHLQDAMETDAKASEMASVAFKAWRESKEYPYATYKKVPGTTKIVPAAPVPVPASTVTDTMSVDALTADTPLKKFVRFFKEGKRDE